MQLQQVLETTGTCRFFAPDAVPDDQLARVLDAARWAPSGGNRHPVRLIAVRDPARKRDLAALYLPRWKAYLRDVRAAGAGDGPLPRLVANADHLTTLLCADEARVRELLRIPDGVITGALIALGRPARGFPAHLRRRPLAEVAFGDEWGRGLAG